MQTNNEDQCHSSGPDRIDPMETDAERAAGGVVDPIETYPEITYLPMPIEKRPTPDFIKFEPEYAE